MALSVTSTRHQKTWDATVRVTGGHPLQLWGIGESQQATETGLQLDRVVVRGDDERMVGYGQLQIRQESIGVKGGSITAVECLHVHANRASALPGLLDALAEYAESAWGALLFSVELDAAAAPELVAALGERGWQRSGRIAEGDAGPRRLRVNLGSSERDLSARLSAQTLDRCRAGLRVSDVAVREVTERSGDLRASGLKTDQIGHLLRELGQDSLLLVATQERPGQSPVALGYLWFVHTVGQAMLYRVGFTRTARELGIDDALLLTGAVELQKRGVQRLDGGDAADPDVPTVVRELADRERIILGPWRRPLGEAARKAADSAAAASEAPEASDEASERPQRARGLFGARRRRGAAADTASGAAAQTPVASSAAAGNSGQGAAAAGTSETPETPETETARAADRGAQQRRRAARRQVGSDLGVETTAEVAPVGVAGDLPTGSAGAVPKSADPEETGPKTTDPTTGDRQAADSKPAELASDPASSPRLKGRGKGKSKAAQKAIGRPAPAAKAEPSPSPRPAPTPPAPEPTAQEQESEQERSPWVSREKRQSQAARRRGERVARSAETIESQHRTRAPLGQRVRDDVRSALRDALGR